MRRSIRPHETASIEDEHDVQALKCAIVDHLIEGALEERRIDGNDGNISLGRHTRCERDGMLFGNTHVKKTFRHLAMQMDQAGAIRHGGRNAYHFIVLPAHFDEGLAKNCRI